VLQDPLLGEQRSRKRESLLKATEAQLGKIAAAVTRESRPLRDADKIALRLGRVVNRYKMAKHFDTAITEDSFSFSRDEEQIAAEAALDGIYVLPTSLSDEALSSGPFAPSTPTSTSARSATGAKSGSAPTSFCRCCPTTSPSI